MFERFGRVTRVFLAKDRETGVAKGFAFLSYADRGDAEKDGRARLRPLGSEGGFCAEGEAVKYSLGCFSILKTKTRIVFRFNFVWGRENGVFLLFSFFVRRPYLAIGNGG